MNAHSLLRDLLVPWLRDYPRIKRFFARAEIHADLARHCVAPILPLVIQPQPRNLTVAITAYCNLRCLGCRYGRDFMPGAQLSWPMAREMPAR